MDDEPKLIKGRIEEVMASAGFPGECELEWIDDVISPITFTLSNGSRVGTSCGGRMTALRTWEDLADYSSRQFIGWIQRASGRSK